MSTMRMGRRLALKLMDLLIPISCPHEFGWGLANAKIESTIRYADYAGLNNAYDWRSMRRCGRTRQIGVPLKAV
jgi:hypothetical protein